MKRAVLLLFPFVLLWSCQEPEPPPMLNISPASCVLPPEGGSFTVDIETNVEVQYTVAAQGTGWVQGPSGSLGNGPAHFTVSFNDVYEDRSSMITFKTADGSISRGFVVNQTGGTGIVLDEETYHIDGNAQTLVVKVKANESFTATSEADWIVQQKTRGLTTFDLLFEVDENRTFEPREGKIRIEGEDKEWTVTVLQDEKGGVIIDPLFIAPGDAGTFEIPFTTNVESTLELEPGQDWLAYAETRSLVRSVLVLRLEENTTGSPRSSVLRFRDGSGGILSETTLTQLVKDEGIVFTVRGNAWETPELFGLFPYWLTDWGDGYWSPINTAETHTFGNGDVHTVRILESGVTKFTVSVKGIESIDLRHFNRKR